MDTTGKSSALAEIPADDGSIDRAIDELDARINAWIQAVADAQRVVTTLAQRPVPAEAAPPADLPPAKVAAPASVAAPAKPAAAASGKSEAAGAKEAKAQPAAATEKASAASGKAESKKSTGLRLGHLGGKKQAESKGKKGIRVFEEEETPVPIETHTAEDDEDERLLSTLDPQIARKIRIKRRLCNNTKSVRELLAEEKR